MTRKEAAAHIRAYWEGDYKREIFIILNSLRPRTALRRLLLQASLLDAKLFRAFIFVSGLPQLDWGVDSNGSHYAKDPLVVGEFYEITSEGEGKYKARTFVYPIRRGLSLFRAKWACHWDLFDRLFFHMRNDLYLFEGEHEHSYYGLEDE